YSRAGRVAWNVFLWTAIPAVVTSLIGSTLAAASAPDLLRTTFSIFLIISVIILLRGKFTPHEENVPVRHVALVGTGIIAGTASAYLGIAGGVIMVSLFLIWAKLPVEKGPGTSAAVGIVTTSVGTIGYIIHGLGVPNLPSGTFGFLIPTYAVALMFGTILGAPIGAKLNHRFGTKIFRFVFAVFLLFIAGRLLLRSL
ncbi:sulfite exporter TauE/SafE family protein, partial [bacterium]|nr:sulfite exporter TauE/SafE family protein [bacterium]